MNNGIRSSNLDRGDYCRDKPIECTAKYYMDRIPEDESDVNTVQIIAPTFHGLEQDRMKEIVFSLMLPCSLPTYRAYLDASAGA